MGEPEVSILHERPVTHQPTLKTLSCLKDVKNSGESSSASFSNLYSSSSFLIRSLSVAGAIVPVWCDIEFRLIRREGVVKPLITGLKSRPGNIQLTGKRRPRDGKHSP